MPGRIRPALIGLAFTANLAVVGSTLLALAAPAVAAAPQTSRSVAYADLNLATPGGVAALEARVAQAAKRLCAQNGAATAASHLASRRCLASALQDVKPAVREAAVRQRNERFAALLIAPEAQ